MKVTIGATNAADTGAAIADALAQVGDAAPGLIIAHIAATHDGRIVRDAIKARFGSQTPVHGGTSCLGVMSNAGAFVEGGTGLGIACFEDAEGDFGVGIADLGENPRAAAAEAARAALEQAGRAGEAPDLIWLTAAPGAEEAVIAGVEDVVGGECRIVGGSAADNSIAGDWFTFDGDNQMSNGVAVTVLFPSGGCSSAYQSGYAPTETCGIATSAKGRRVFEIDGAPAGRIYADWTDGAVAAVASGDEPDAILAASTFAPLGRKSAYVADVPFYLLAHPATAHPDGSIEFFADIDEGEELRLMNGGVDSLTSRAGRVAAQAAEGVDGAVAGALVVYCGGCMLAVQEHMDRVAAGVDAALGGAPFLGVFTFGEQGPVLNRENRHGNLMISCVTFAA